MNIEEIRKAAPKGATHYNSDHGVILYFFRSSQGFRQIKGNIINFYDSGIYEIKPL